MKVVARVKTRMVKVFHTNFLNYFSYSPTYSMIHVGAPGKGKSIALKSSDGKGKGKDAKGKDGGGCC